MRSGFRPFLAAFLVVAVVLIACGDSEEVTESPGDRVTKQELSAAYAALQEAADGLAPAEFARFQRSVIRDQRQRPGELTTTDYLAVVEYLSKRGMFLSVALTEPTDKAEVDKVLSGIEFHDDPRALTLIAPARLGNSPPAELIEAGVILAAISPSGQIFCLGPADDEPHPCDPPERPS